MRFSRRTLLAVGGAALAVPALAYGQSAALRQKKLVVFILRGGMDGLAVVAPVGDPDYPRVRGRLATQSPLPLDAMFALHPRAPTLHALYGAGELLPIHACATGYRERSHFDAQNVLETGAAAPFARDSGWLNAALATLPRGAGGVALNAQAPLILRGDAPASTWSPSVLAAPNDDLMTRLMDLYDARDPALAEALRGAQSANAIAGDGAMSGGRGRGVEAAAALARVAGNFLTEPNGPVAAVIELGGWDTHANQAPEQGPLARALAALDASIAALRDALGPSWGETVVAIVTEFGRTAAPNGNGGTDHGAAAAAFLAGGATAGGRVLADWPGLSQRALHEGRDLRPTTDLRAVLKGVLSAHWRVSDRALATSVFPDSAGVAAIEGLVRT